MSKVRKVDSDYSEIKRELRNRNNLWIATDRGPQKETDRNWKVKLKISA